MSEYIIFLRPEEPENRIHGSRIPFGTSHIVEQMQCQTGHGAIVMRPVRNEHVIRPLCETTSELCGALLDDFMPQKAEPPFPRSYTQFGWEDVIKMLFGSNNDIDRRGMVEGVPPQTEGEQAKIAGRMPERVECSRSHSNPDKLIAAQLSDHPVCFKGRDDMLRRHYEAGRADAFKPPFTQNQDVEKLNDQPASDHHANEGLTLRPWSQAEDDILRKHYPTEGICVAARLPGRTRKAALQRSQELGIRKAWTFAEDAILKAYYPIEDGSVVSRLAGRTQDDCQQRAKELGLRAPTEPEQAVTMPVKTSDDKASQVTTVNATTDIEAICQQVREFLQSGKGGESFTITLAGSRENASNE